MTHPNYTVDTTYFSIQSDSLYHGGLLNEDLDAYILNPNILQSMGLNLNSSLTIEQFNTFRATLTAPLTFPDTTEFLLSTWVANSWGSVGSDVLYNYNNFMNRHIEAGGSIRSAFNPHALATSSIIANGKLTEYGPAYFFPILVFSSQNDANPTGDATAPIIVSAAVDPGNANPTNLTVTFTGAATSYVVEYYQKGNWGVAYLGAVSGASPKVISISRYGVPITARVTLSNGLLASTPFSFVIGPL